MKLPDKVYGQNKLRDAKIIQMYMDGNSMEEIALKIKLSIPRVQQIIYRNRDLLRYDKKYEKAKRINWLLRQVRNSGKSNKDPADILEQMRRELEGEKQPVYGGGETKIVIVRSGEQKPAENNRLEVIESQLRFEKQEEIQQEDNG